MQVFPAIDIRAGHCVRLFQGDYARETVFDEDPLNAARRWLEAGARRLHVVDLDGAREGSAVNFSHVAAIAGLGVPVQVGGGVRDLPTARRYREAGVSRVILGTTVLRDPDAFAAIQADEASFTVVSIDARDGRVATDGWTETSAVDAVDLARELAGRGVQRFIYTDINSDGTLTAPNYDAVSRLIAASGVPVIAAGGVSSVEQLRRLAALGAEGAIIGRALYDGRLELAEALAAAGDGPA